MQVPSSLSVVNYNSNSSAASVPTAAVSAPSASGIGSSSSTPKRKRTEYFDAVEIKDVALDDPKPIGEMSRMQFVKEDNRSYPLSQLFERALQEIQLHIKEVASKPEEVKITSVYHMSPSNNQYFFSYAFEVRRRGIDEHMKQEILDDIKRSTIVDWSSTSHQAECSLTQEKYEKPYLLNINGRTYSEKAILKAFEETLYQDKSLRLEDTILQPSMLTKIKLYPNMTLWKDVPKTLEFSAEMVKATPFDELKAKSCDIKGFSEFLGASLPDENQMWDICAIYNKYADARELPHFAGNGETIENIVIRGIKFPPHHPKVNIGLPITFKNVLFENCKIDMDCWCGLKVKSSQFVNCTVDLPGRSTLMTMTRLIQCTLRAKQASRYARTGTFRHIEQHENALSLIGNIVEERKNLVDCTLDVG